MKIAKHARRLAASTLAGLCCAMGGMPLAWSADPNDIHYGTDYSNAFEIESGMWAFGGELNGKPGRGLQIDEQDGDLVIVTYFGYRADGSALFMQASGPRTNNQFVGEMLEYKNGRVIGGPPTSGEPASSVGSVKIVFESPTHGRITMPIEGEKSIRRLQFFDATKRMSSMSRFSGSQQINQSGEISPYLFFVSAEQGRLKFVKKAVVRYGNNPPSECIYEGEYYLVGKGIDSSGSYSCVNANDQGTYEAKQLTVSRDGVFAGKMKTRSSLDGGTNFTQFYGFCTSGTDFLADIACVPPGVLWPN